MHTPKAQVMYAHHHLTQDGKLVFRDFASEPRVVALYDRKDEIVRVYLRPVEDGEESPYWGWWQEGRGYGMVFPRKVLFEMCFPYGYKVSEQKGDGVAVNVVVTQM